MSDNRNVPAPPRTIWALAGASDAAANDQYYGRVVRFLAVGLLNTAFGYALFAAIYAISRTHPAAIVLATVGAVVFNFVSTGRLVFASSSMSRLLPFLAGCVLVMAVNVALVDIGVILAISPFAGQAIALPIVAAMAFFINDRFVFRRAQ